MTQEVKKDYDNNDNFQFSERNIQSDKGRYHCRLIGKYRWPPQSKCNINVTQDQSNYIPFILQNFSNYDCHLFFKKLVDKKDDKVKLK